ncbi:MAG: hypothetical protein ACXVLT_14040 [Flavisolibacter sp.]
MQKNELFTITELMNYDLEVNAGPLRKLSSVRLTEINKDYST